MATRQLAIFLIVPRGTLLFIEWVNEMLITTQEDVQLGESSKLGCRWASLGQVIHILFAGDLGRGTATGTCWNITWAVYSHSLRR